MTWQRLNGKHSGRSFGLYGVIVASTQHMAYDNDSTQLHSHDHEQDVQVEPRWYRSTYTVKSPMINAASEG